MSQSVVAILDVGKTNTKLMFVDAERGVTLSQVERPSAPIATSMGLQLDVQAIEDWLRSSIAASAWRNNLSAIVPIAHGAAAVLLDESGAVLAAPDYEDPSFEQVADDYRKQRDVFAATFSPFLPLGLNLGRQLFWLQQQAPALMHRCTHILTYAQYWSWRLSGVMSCEVTSLGCHTDLWLPLTDSFSQLAIHQGWAGKFAPLRKASDVLGLIRSNLAHELGVTASCKIICGIHDSNASYLAHALSQPSEQPFAVVSSGTWTVIMARGVALACLREARDMLVNVDAFGQAVATARFAGGREYQEIAGVTSDAAEPSEACLQAVLTQQAAALPCFSAAGGPYAGQVGRLINADALDARQRTAMASLYVALMTDLLLDELGTRGEILIDGPLANNAIFGRILATLRPTQAVRASNQRDGSVHAALYLAGFGANQSKHAPALTAMAIAEQLHNYRQRWRRMLPA